MQLKVLELKILNSLQENKLKKPHEPKLILIEFGVMDGDKHSFAKFKGRKQLEISTCPNDTLSHEGTIDALKEYFESDD